MKFLFVIGLPVPYPGAAWARIESLVNSLINAGHQVLIIGTEKRKNLPYLVNVFLKTREALNIPTFFITTLINILRYRPNLVIISIPPAIHALGASLACYVSRKKMIFDYRDQWEDYLIGKAFTGIKKLAYRILKIIMTYFYLRATLIITVTPPFVDYLLKRKVKNVYLIPNGADTNLFKPVDDKKSLRIKYGLGENDFILIYIGYVGKYYKLDVCVKSLARHIEMDPSARTKLLIVGEGEDVKRVFELSKLLKIEDRIIYMGVKYDKKKLAELIALADIGLIPYDKNYLWKSALSTKFFEYAACGIPIIATVWSQSILAKIIDKEKIGMYVKPENVEELVSAISFLSSNKDFLENL